MVSILSSCSAKKGLKDVGAKKSPHVVHNAGAKKAGASTSATTKSDDSEMIAGTPIQLNYNHFAVNADEANDDFVVVEPPTKAKSKAGKPKKALNEILA